MAKVALVTGASKGIGRGIALELARQKFDVWINYNSDRAGAEQTAAEVAALGQQAFIVQADVGRAADVAAMFQQIEKLDLMVNNAGQQTWKPLLDLTEAEWDLVIDTNLKGCFLCTQHAARLMLQTGGSIVNIGSGCNKLAFPSLASYTASKGGIETFTKVAAAELGRYQIRVNCVAPGAIEIERTKLEIGDYAGTWAGVTPMGRIGTPGDVANVVAFLASPAAEFVSGQTIFVDGGLLTKPHWPYQE